MEVRSIESIVGALNEAGVRYLVVGGLAVNVHGYMKTKAGREKDLADVAALRKLDSHR